MLAALRLLRSARAAPLRPPPGRLRSAAAEGPADVSLEMLDHLERLALVDFRNQEGVERLKRAVEFAEQLHAVDTEGVEPMASVLEGRSLYLREDEVTEGNSAEELLKMAKRTVEEYFVAPPGNIPLPKLEDRETFLKEEES